MRILLLFFQSQGPAGIVPQCGAFFISKSSGEDLVGLGSQIRSFWWNMKKQGHPEIAMFSKSCVFCPKHFNCHFCWWFCCPPFHKTPLCRSPAIRALLRKEPCSFEFTGIHVLWPSKPPFRSGSTGIGAKFGVQKFGVFVCTGQKDKIFFPETKSSHLTNGRPLEKEIPIQKHDFQGAMLVLGSIYIPNWVMYVQLLHSCGFILNPSKEMIQLEYNIYFCWGWGWWLNLLYYSWLYEAFNEGISTTKPGCECWFFSWHPPTKFRGVFFKSRKNWNLGQTWDL